MSSNAFSAPSAATSQSYNGNAAAPSSTATQQVGASASADCRAFGDLVSVELQNMSTSRQSQLKSEILASIAKFKKAEADSRRSNETTDECAVCMEKMTKKAFTGECLHVFCFECIQQWVGMKSTCPICVGQVKTLLYNVRSNDDYDVYKFP